MKFQFKLKWKIFVGGLGLSIAIVATNLGYSTHIIQQAAARQHELEKVLRRYDLYQRNMSSGYSAAIEAWSVSAADLRRALAQGDDAAARPLIQSVERSIEEDLRPDFMVFVDKHGDATFSSNAPIGVADVHSMALFSDLRAGRKVKDSLLTHRGRTYLVNGVPFIDHDGTTVGTMVVGVALEHLFEEFKSQSDDDPKKQVDFALVSTTGITTTATAPRDLWDDIARAAVKSPPDTVREHGENVPVFILPDGPHDFHGGVRNGYEGATPGVVGTLYALRNRADQKQQLDDLIKNNVVVGLAGMLFAFLVSLLIAVGVSRPLRRVIEATGEIARGQGDLTRRLVVRTHDELGELADNINAVFANLQQLAAEVQHASQQVGASSGEISASSKQMLAGAKEQAIKIESSTAAVTELSSSIQQVADNAMQATRVAKESGDQVQSAIEGMGRIQRTVDEASEKIHDLGESGKRIGNIVEVIRQISEQTSLLALNASIEAAHAGEQGRGFAVVADEVSSLARRVGQSAKDIEDLIATIKDQTSEAVTSMQSGKREVEGGTQHVVHTLGSLKQIIEVIQDTASAVQEQAVVSDEIARNMDAVQKIAQEVLASSEAAVIHGENLHELAVGLEESVRGFRIGERAPRPEPPPGRARIAPLLAKPALPLPRPPSGGSGGKPFGGGEPRGGGSGGAGSPSEGAVDRRRNLRGG